MSTKHPYQIINPPSLLKAKVGGELEYDEEVVARAEAAVAELAEEYEAWLQNDLIELARLRDEVKGDPDRARSHLDEMARRVHEVKGQAGTFGYTLVTTLADSLGDMLDRLEGLDDPSRQHPRRRRRAGPRAHPRRAEGGRAGRRLSAGPRDALTSWECPVEMRKNESLRC
jgi:HPt (histidine-containing phosphotransfer) domain-containing protein